jgi:hypothetical protein
MRGFKRSPTASSASSCAQSVLAWRSSSSSAATSPSASKSATLNERAMVKLATERKHLTNIIKMVAYQTESDLLALLRPHYARVDQEGRTLLHELFATAGDIRVCGSELRITLAPQLTASNPRRRGPLRDARPNGYDLPRRPPAPALCYASATAYRACLPRLAGRAQHRRRPAPPRRGQAHARLSQASGNWMTLLTLSRWS